MSIAYCFTALASGTGDTARPYHAAVEALARHANSIILSIPDLATFDEKARTRLLGSLSDRSRSARLLWRPVSACLHAIVEGAIDAADVGERIGFFIHGHDGLEAQVLTIRSDPEHEGHLAPERDGYGSAFAPKLAMHELDRKATMAMLRGTPALELEPCEKPRVAMSIMTGEAKAGIRSVLRHDNGNWIEFVTPDLVPGEMISPMSSSTLEEAVAFLGPLRKCFFLSPLCEAYQSPIVTPLRKHFPGLQILPWRALACGALRAGRLIELGLPHYFDRLTPISLAVRDGDEPSFEDLIGSGAAVPANREYVSPPYTSLRWGQGKKEMDFYVLKGSEEVRHWRVQLGSAPSEDVPIELRLRQTPGQSWAKLTLTSHDWEPLARSPLALNWEYLRPDDRTPKQVLDALRTPPPTIPRRIIHPPALECWRGDGKIGGFFDILASLEGKNKLDSSAVATYVARPYSFGPGRRGWLVGTDGDLPGEINAAERNMFEALILDAEATLLSAVRKRTVLPDNSTLRTLTWIFARCPKSVQTLIVEALEASYRGDTHVLLGPLRSLTVVTQGAGRVVSDVRLLERVLYVLANRPANADTLNALAMILSRRKDAPLALNPALVKVLAELVARDIVAQTSALAFKQRFKCAISALAGLFRYREVEPFALLASKDDFALSIDGELQKTENLLEQHQHRISGYAEKREIVQNLRDYLQGAGDPDILFKTDPFASED